MPIFNTVPEQFIPNVTSHLKCVRVGREELQQCKMWKIMCFLNIQA